MKLMWFHLMPYTELPDDFRDANPSVWVDIHSSLFDPKRAHLMYNDFMDELEYAAEVGFDAICVNEHHSNGYGLMPSPNLIASSLARRTTRHGDLRDGQLARAVQSADPRGGRIRHDRLHLRRPADRRVPGRHADGHLLRLRHKPEPACASAIMEAHDLVVRAWTEKDTFAFNGRFNQQRYVNIWPRPVQQPHPPIWVPGGGSVETWRWCAEMDYVYCYLSYYGYKAGRATMDGFWAEMDRLGKERNPYQAGFLQFVGVGESRQHAFDLYAEAAEYFYGRCLHVDPKWATPPGYTSEGSQRAGIESQVKKAADADVRGKSTGERFASVAREMDAIVDNGYVIIGSPDEVAEQLREVAVNLNVGHLMLLLQYRQHEQGPDPLQHQTVRRAGDAEAEGSARRLERPLVAATDASRRSARTSPPSSLASPPNNRRNGANVSEPQTLTIDVNGFSTRVWRKGSGPKLGFLAGFGGLPRWMPFLDELAKRRTLIVPSLPGFPGGDRGHTVLDTHLDWMLAVREILEKAELGRRRSRRQFGRRLAGVGGRRAVARLGAQAGVDRPVRSVRREGSADRSLGAARRRGAGADVRRSRDLEGDESRARGCQLDRMADRARPRHRGRRPHLLAARQHPDREAAATDQGADAAVVGRAGQDHAPRLRRDVRQRHRRPYHNEDHRRRRPFGRTRQASGGRAAILGFLGAG